MIDAVNYIQPQYFLFTSAFILGYVCIMYLTFMWCFIVYTNIGHKLWTLASCNLSFNNEAWMEKVNEWDSKYHQSHLVLLYRSVRGKKWSVLYKYDKENDSCKPTNFLIRYSIILSYYGIHTHSITKYNIKNKSCYLLCISRNDQLNLK